MGATASYCLGSLPPGSLNGQLPESFSWPGESIELVDVASGKSSPLTVGAGATSVMASGLLEDHPYLARLAGTSSPALAFRTRPRSAAPGSVRLFSPSGASVSSREAPLPRGAYGDPLSSASGPPGLVALAQRGRELFLAAGFNRTRGSRIQFTQSADEGETWYDPVAFTDSAAEIDRLSPAPRAPISSQPGMTTPLASSGCRAGRRGPRRGAAGRGAAVQALPRTAPESLRHLEGDCARGRRA